MPTLAISRKQAEFLAIAEPYSLFVGGVGSGKTAGGARWAIREALDRSAAIPGLIAANTDVQLQTVTLPAFTDVLDVLGRTYRYNCRPPRSWGQSRFKKHYGILSIRLRRRRMTQIHCRSLTNEVPLRGLEIGWAWLDETRDTKSATWEIILARLRGFGERQGFRDHVNRIAVTTTPAGFNWLYATWIGSESYPDSAFVTASSYDNPWLDASYADNLLRKYPKRLAEQEIFGKFVNIATGQAYADFSRDKSIRDDLCRYDPRLDLIHAWDFNLSPLCSVILQTDGKRVFVIDEIHIEHSARTLDAAEEFINRYGKHCAPRAAAARGPAIAAGKAAPSILVYGDASGRHASTASPVTDFDIIRAKYTSHFGPRIEMRPNYNNPEQPDRVNSVNALLQSADGTRRLFLHSKCEHTIIDLEQVAFVPGTRQLNKKDADRTHHTDALGYYVNMEFPIDRPPFSGYLTG